MQGKFIDWLRRPSENPATAAIVLLIVGGLIMILGYDYLHGAIRLQNIVADFYANAGAELISIAITVLVIDTLNQRRERRIESEQKRIAQEAEEEAEKKRLILHMGSPDNAIAVEAVRILKTHGWLDDGSLDGAYLAKANLQNVDLRVSRLKTAILFESNLRNADLFHANLQKANLIEADLQDGTFTMVNLKGAQMFQANVKGTDLRFANLQEAQLHEIDIDESTTLPDETKFDPNEGLEQLRRFTDSEHPDFWRPEPFPGTDKYPWWYEPDTD